VVSPCALSVRETKPLSSELLAEGPILGSQILDEVQLLTADPSDQSEQQELNRERHHDWDGSVAAFHNRRTSSLLRTINYSISEWFCSAEFWHHTGFQTAVSRYLLNPAAMISGARKPSKSVREGYRPRDEQLLAELPATVYALRPVEEIEGLLGESGFVEIRSTERSIGKSRYAFTEARCPAPAAPRGRSA
jgi:hypothetical protein